MKLIDKGINPIGEFSITSIFSDGSSEVYEEKNLIMDNARVNMAELIGGVVDIGLPINKFVIGNKGHKDTNLLDYKLVGEDDFLSARTMLFSEDVNNDLDDAPNFSYEITFDTVSSLSIVSDEAAIGRISPKGKEDASLVSNDTQTCTVERVIEDRTCTFTITIPNYAGNADSVQGGVVPYTEAALYAGDKIFSMKTFPVRVKEETVKLIIVWSIIF